MIVQQTDTGPPNSKIIERWSTYLKEVYAHVAHRFSRAEGRERAYRYLTGLLANVRRKNGWQMAEAIGETTRRPNESSSSGIHCE